MDKLIDYFKKVLVECETEEKRWKDNVTLSSYFEGRTVSLKHVINMLEISA